MGDFDQLVLRDFSLAVGDDKRNRADVSGKIADLTRWKGVDLQVKADLRDGGPWRPLLDLKFPVIDTAHVKGRLTDAAGRVEGFALRVDGKKFRVEVAGRIGNLRAGAPWPVRGLATLTGSKKAVKLTRLECTLGKPGHDWVEVTGTVGDLVAMRT